MYIAAHFGLKFGFFSWIAMSWLVFQTPYLPLLYHRSIGNFLIKSDKGNMPASYQTSCC